MPLVPTYQQSRLDVSAHSTLSMVTTIRWISNVTDPRLPSISVQHLGTSNSLDVHCGLLDITLFWPPSSHFPLQRHGPSTLCILFSPLNDRIDQSRCLIWLYFLSSYTLSELQDRDKLLNIYNVDVQSARVTDILTTFCTALRNEGQSSLLLLAESLRVCLLSRCTASRSQNLIT